MRKICISLIFLFSLLIGQPALADSLLTAAEQGNTKLINKLLSEGADVNIQSAAGWSPLMNAASEGHAQAVRILLANGADINLADNNREYTALHWAADWNQAGAIAAMIESGVDANLRTRWNDSALNIAAQRGNGDVIRVLCKAGVDVNEQTSDGMTALMLAASGRDGEGMLGPYDNMESIQPLLECGADPNIKNSDGKTALDIASNNGFEATTALLKKVTKQ